MSQEAGLAPEVDVLIAGAGMAGLMAACLLAESDLSVLVVEAADQVGGRMRSHRVAGLKAPVELGAEFVHGRPADLISLIKEAGLHLEEVEGRDYCFQHGQVGPCEEHQGLAVIARMANFCKDHPGLDMSFQDYLRDSANARPLTPGEDASLTPDTTLNEDARQSARRYVEGFNAADADAISIQSLSRQQEAEDAIEGDRLFRVSEGYSALARFLERRLMKAGGRIVFRTTIQEVSWRPGAVAFCMSPATGPRLLKGRQALITLPLGVLQSAQLLFSPRPDYLDLLQSMAMGTVLRLTLGFRKPFWDTTQSPRGDMSFLLAPETFPGVFWTRSPMSMNRPHFQRGRQENMQQATLTAWVGGPAATNVGSQAFVEQTVEALAKIFQLPADGLRSLIVSTHLHDWNQDPLTLGAYSYVREGGMEQSARLSLPVADTLFFAGEHTDTTGHWGTVHGAMRSGIRAAGQIMQP